MAVNETTINVASNVTGIHGRYHACNADAERIAVSPQVGTQPHQDGAVGAERLGAGRRDAADAVRPHHDQLDPAGHRHPAQDQADDEERHCRAALAHDQRPDQEETLVRATHCERRRSHPAEGARVLAAFFAQGRERQ
jgi:hypothetical protein